MLDFSGAVVRVWCCAGVTDHVWSAADIVAMIEAAEPAPTKRGPYKKQMIGLRGKINDTGKADHLSGSYHYRRPARFVGHMELRLQR